MHQVVPVPGSHSGFRLGALIGTAAHPGKSVPIRVMQDETHG